ncbi:MAG: class I SAM-dependent methyltransferase [Desulfovibrio sp.]|jgi:cyclopropane fatty-acyl-phospholipid synthase-like methyltransferase|nr:class I SAM-dependent methyltransferase [Desulfovibrio sp.]
MSDAWTAYWNRGEAMDGRLWQAQCDFFVSRVRKEIPLGPDDVLLDIGCGRGYTAEALAPELRAAHGADTSLHALEEARLRCAGIPGLTFHLLAPDAYLDIHRLPVRNVSVIFCVSVVQYYKNIGEVRTLIANAKKIAAPGCRMLLADLLVDYNGCLDVAGVLIGGLESGTFCAKLQEVFSGKHRLYGRTRAEHPVLTMRRAELEAVCAAENTRLRFIRRNLTGNRFRAHALIEILPAVNAC